VISLLILSGCLLGPRVGLAADTAAREIYVSPEGDDTNPGTRDQPWKTLAKVGAEAAPGDTFYLLPGEYPGPLVPARGGQPDRPVVFRSVERHRAVLHAASGEGPVFVLRGAEHVTLDGLHVTGRERTTWFRIEDCQHITIENCRFDLSSGSTSGVIRHSQQLHLIGNLFSRDQFWGNMVDVQMCSHFLIQGNSFTRAGHCPLQITQGRFGVIRANCFRNDWGRNYEFWSSGRLLIEGNVITAARDSAGSADSRAKNLYHDSIFRFNRVYGNLHTPLNSGSYFPVGGTPTNHHREPFRLVNSRIYHNTIVDNLGQGWQFNGMNISQNAFFNNIVAGNDKTGDGVQLWVADDLSRDNRFLNNLLHGAEPGRKVVRYGGEYYTAAQIDQRTGIHQGFWTEFGDNRDDAPRWRDAANRDYRLDEGSPAIDAGRPLALAIGRGSGAVLPVSDGVAFYDGFGIAGEKGDWIAVARPDQLARIERVELRYYQAALLHLDRQVQWTDGAPVSLPWTGRAPDIGVFEHGLTHPGRVEAFAVPSTTSPGNPVRFSLEPHGQEFESVLWDFGDGGTSTDLQPTHTYDHVARHGVSVQARLANGEPLSAVVFVDVVAAPEDHPPLAWADFEHQTRWEWGYHFKFYRNDLTDWRFVDAVGYRDSRCVHLRAAPGRKTNTSTCKIAPGEWAIDRYPIVRFAYRIPPGVPVAIALEPFSARGLPSGFVLGGTENHPVGRYRHIDKYRLIDDGRWHTIRIDVRAVREAVPDLQYLQRFLLYLQWGRDADPEHEFWFDDFVIEAQES
jgi:hypothetical protein